MNRALALDYGSKRTGVAISDPLRMIANGLDTVASSELIPALKRIFEKQAFDTIVIGQPRRMDGSFSDIEMEILPTIERIKAAFPEAEIVRLDERFTSKIAMQTMIAAGSSKTQRREKGNLDKISAALLLQEYLNQGTR